MKALAYKSLYLFYKVNQSLLLTDKYNEKRLLAFNDHGNFF